MDLKENSTFENNLNKPTKACIRLKIGIEIELDFNQSEERKPILSLVNFRSVFYYCTLWTGTHGAI